MRKILFLISFSLFAFVLMGQTHSSADRLFQAGDYSNAQAEYGALLKTYPRNALYLYRYARCAQELGDFTTALRYFDLSGDRYDLKHFYVGDIHLQLWHTNEAIQAYETYLTKPNLSPERVAHVENQLRVAEKLQRYLRRVERIQVIDSIEVPIDSMLDICLLSHEAGILTRDSLGTITYTNQRGDRKLWTAPVDSSHYLLSSHRLLNAWTSPDTLPANINFTDRQTAPYVLSDGVTLYFAANDTNGLGGSDIYISRYNISTETYTTPENIGLPYNSPANEYFFLLDETRHIGYLATDRFAAEGKVHIYSFVIPEYKQYWRNLPTDSLVAYAKLRHFEFAQNDSLPLSLPTIVENTDEIADFTLVINDSTIYHSLTDFHQSAAKEKYIQWKHLNTQYHTEFEQLAQLRLQYATADKAQQKELTPLILRLENNQIQLLQRCQALLIEIRQIEMSAH